MMNFPNRDAITVMIEDKLEKGISMIKMLESLADHPLEIRASFVFFPLKVTGGSTVFIPIGTKDKPAGISTSKCPYVLVFDEEEVLVFHMDTVKGFVKAKYKELEWTMDKWYDMMGFNINIKNLIEYESESRTK